jgi:hypothetical protein
VSTDGAQSDPTQFAKPGAPETYAELLLLPAVKQQPGLKLEKSVERLLKPSSRQSIISPTAPLFAPDRQFHGLDPLLSRLRRPPQRIGNPCDPIDDERLCREQDYSGLDHDEFFRLGNDPERYDERGRSRGGMTHTEQDHQSARS